LFFDLPPYLQLKIFVEQIPAAFCATLLLDPLSKNLETIILEIKKIGKALDMHNSVIVFCETKN